MPVKPQRRINDFWVIYFVDLLTFIGQVTMEATTQHHERRSVLSLSQTTGYAVLALSCIHGPEGNPVLVRDIASCTGIPKPYLSKIIHALACRGLIVTRRGCGGGVTLSKPPDQISLLDVAEAVEGSSWLPLCILGLEDCSDLRACPTHDFWKAESKRIETKLRKTSMADVVRFEQAVGGFALCGCGDQNRKKPKSRGKATSKDLACKPDPGGKTARAKKEAVHGQSTRRSKPQK